MNLTKLVRRESEQIAILLPTKDDLVANENYSHTPYKITSFKKIKYLDATNLICKSFLNPKELRNYSRKTLFIFECLYSLNLKQYLENVAPDRVGIYFSGPSCSMPWSSMNALKTENLGITKAMRKNFPPKFFLTEGIGISPGQIAIQFGLTGPLNAFYWENGGPSAELKASLDLKNNLVDKAVIAAVNTYEDPFLTHIHVQKSENAIYLNECAAAYVMSKDSELIAKNSNKPSSHYYGYLNYLSQLIGDEK
jgi:hypothetical protein